MPQRESNGHGPIRYAQCWEDADVLLEALDVQPGDHCLSIASAGDNALSLLTREPATVLAIDMNPAQLACLALRVAAYRTLHHEQLLELMGSRQSDRRPALYETCRPQLDEPTRAFWDARRALLERGLGAIGRFEHYFRVFRRYVLPLVHPSPRVRALLEPRSRTRRHQFYRQQWETWRWRLMFRVFFSRWTMSRLGRDPTFFEQVRGSVAEPIRQRAAHALTELDPAANPYLQWILLERHATALPHALREQNFEPIRRGLERLSWRACDLRTALERGEGGPWHRFNLSDVFEYLDEPTAHALLARLAERSVRGGRLVYWNMLVPRSRPASLSERLQPREALAERLHARDKAFFYSRLVIEDVIG